MIGRKEFVYASFCQFRSEALVQPLDNCRTISQPGAGVTTLRRFGRRGLRATLSTRASRYRYHQVRKDAPVVDAEKVDPNPPGLA